MDQELKNIGQRLNLTISGVSRIHVGHSYAWGTRYACRMSQGWRAFCLRTAWAICTMPQHNWTTKSGEHPAFYNPLTFPNLSIYAGQRLSRGMIASIMRYVCVLFLWLCLCMSSYTLLKYASHNCASAEEVYRVPGHGTYALVWV